MAEDNSVNQRLALELLGKWGCTAAAVLNGRQALDALEEEAFDVVLMDVQMPTMDGYEATRTLRRRELETGNHIPVIAMTAHALEKDRQLCLDAGVDGYVAKPISREALWGELERIMPSNSSDFMPTMNSGAETSYGSSIQHAQPTMPCD